MYSALTGLLLLLAQTPDVPDVGQRVIAELRNGYRIEGVLIEKDRRSAVLSIDSGELRLDLKRVSRFHLPGAPQGTPEKPAQRGRELSLSVRSSKSDRQRLVFSVPDTWKQVDDEDGALTFLASPEGLRFRVEESAQAQSLWKITARLRRTFKASLSGFEVKQERFGNRWVDTRTWEIDFEFDEEGARYRERRLYLDFGDAKRVFVFRTRASSFLALVGHFERITSGLVLEDATRAGDSKASDGEPDPVAPEEERRPNEAKELRIEDIEQALEEEIRQALDGVETGEE